MSQSGRTVSKRSLYGQVAIAMGKRIIDGFYPEGKTLPLEAKLMEEFDISRTALREAFKVLSAKGLIESRPKTGTKVSDSKFWNMLDPDVLNWSFDSSNGNKILEDLFQLRQQIEPRAASLAAQNASEEELARIEDALNRMKSATYGTTDTLTSDVDFHQSILAASGNILMESFGVMIGAALYRSFDVTTHRGEEFWLKAIPMHEAVFQGIQARNPQRAQFEMSSLLCVSDEGARQTF